MHDSDLITQKKFKEISNDLLSTPDTFESQTVESRLSDLIKELDYYQKLTHTLSKKLELSEARAVVDYLTQALNKSAYDLKIGQVLREFSRYKEPVALMVVDIDNFKKINDQFGHKTGDQALVSVAASIQNCIRKSDSLFRYGGEEFVVLTNKICAEDANNLAEKIRTQIEKNCFIDQNPVNKITVSIGVSLLMESDTEHSLFKRADDAMYASKHKGRNAVTMVD